jgi:hypothetical protein
MSKQAFSVSFRQGLSESLHLVKVNQLPSPLCSNQQCLTYPLIAGRPIKQQISTRQFGTPTLIFKVARIRVTSGWKYLACARSNSFAQVSSYIRPAFAIYLNEYVPALFSIFDTSPITRRCWYVLSFGKMASCSRLNISFPYLPHPLLTFFPSVSIFS